MLADYKFALTMINEINHMSTLDSPMSIFFSQKNQDLFFYGSQVRGRKSIGKSQRESENSAKVRIGYILCSPIAL